MAAQPWSSPTIKSWSIMETVLSVSGLVCVLLLGLVI
jgi:H+/gluconate symporter-like permease